MTFYIDVEDGGGNKLGAGPITTATGVRYTSRMDRAGEFEFSMPASDAKSNLLAEKRYIVINQVIGGSVERVFYGVIDEISINTTASPAMITVRGYDIIIELAQWSVGFYEANDQFRYVVEDILYTYAPNWFSVSSITDDVYVKFAGESVLAAIIKLCEIVGVHFWLSDFTLSRELTFINSPTASGLRAVSAGDSDAPELCLITSLEKTHESHDLITRIYPFGAGNGSNRLTLEHTTATAPTGYTLDAVNNFIRNDAAETTYGKIEKYLSFKNIAPISNSLADLQNAADALFAVAYNQLSVQSSPQLHYRLAVTKLDSASLHPLHTLRVVYDEYVDNYHAIAIDDDLYILAITHTIDSAGVDIIELDVANVLAYPRNDFDEIVAKMEEGHILEAHPQLTATKDRVGPYVLRVDPTHAAQFRFDIGAETTALNYAKLRFKLYPLRASVKSVAGTTSTTVSTTSHSHNFVLHKSLSSAATVYFNTTTKEFYILGTGANELVSSLDEENSHSHTLTPNISTTYGIYHDSNYPVNVTIWIDGTDRTLALTGSSTIAGGSSIEATYDITQYLDDQSTLRGTHSIEFRCTEGQGEIEAELAMLMTVQAIAVV